MIRAISFFLITVLLAGASDSQNSSKKKEPSPTPLEQYILEAHKRAASVAESPGSLWSPPATLADMAADVRARSIDDIVTIVVNEQASAVSVGQTKTSRNSSVNSSITAAAGKLSAAGSLANLLTANTATSLDGEGTTSRQTTLTAMITARVTDVLPNGYLVIEGTKAVQVNSENQIITLRGVVRPVDISDANTVQSGNVAQLELQVNGRGVVNDAIHRPNFLYRLILGLLPF